MFTDIPCCQLAVEARPIVRRYRRFLAKRADTPIETIYRGGLRGTVEMLRTGYWSQGLEVIQRRVWFRGISTSHPLKSRWIPAKRRSAVYREMKEWLERNEPHLRWNPDLERFVPGGGREAFDLPPETRRALGTELIKKHGLGAMPFVNVRMPDWLERHPSSPCKRWVETLCSARLCAVLLSAITAAQGPNRQKPTWRELAQEQLDKLYCRLSQLEKLDAFLAAGGPPRTKKEDEYRQNLLRRAPSMTYEEFRDGIARAPMGPGIRSEVLAGRIRFDLSGLWSETGNCLFGDIPPRSLVKQARMVADRYRAFLERHANAPTEQIYVRGLRRNIELLLTEYWNPALSVIYGTVFFDETIIRSGGHQYARLPADVQREVYEEMKEWFRENEPLFSLREGRKMLVPRDGRSAFRLPPKTLAVLMGEVRDADGFPPMPYTYMHRVPGKEPEKPRAPITCPKDGI